MGNRDARANGALAPGTMRPTTTASNLFRRKLCPGSARLETGLPEEKTKQSEEGTLLHNYAGNKNLDRSFLSPKQKDLLELNDGLLGEIARRVLPDSNWWEATHSELHLENEFISGTPDLVVWHDPAGWINDTKFGYKLVETADLNLQLRAYAVLLYDSAAIKPEKIFVSITQPRLSYDHRVSLACYHPEDIEASREQIKAILKESERPKARLIAGEDQCRYCKAKLICPAFKEAFGALAEYHPSEEMTAPAKRAYLEKRLAEVSDQVIEKLMLAVSFSKMIGSPLNDEVRKRILNGGMINYEIGKPFSVREIADTQRAIPLLALAKVMDRESVLKSCNLPLSAIEESYRKKTGCTWKDAKDKINKVLASVLETDEREGRILKK
jgi:hypothetical protein